jgi:hypothetical protein
MVNDPSWLVTTEFLEPLTVTVTPAIGSFLSFLIVPLTGKNTCPDSTSPPAKFLADNGKDEDSINTESRALTDSIFPNHLAGASPGFTLGPACDLNKTKFMMLCLIIDVKLYVVIFILFKNSFLNPCGWILFNIFAILRIFII